MDKGALVGKGLTAEIYEWGADRVLKLFSDRYSNKRIKYEASITDAVHEAGVPSPCVFDIVDVDNRRGIVFQRIYGKTLLKKSLKEPWNMYSYSKIMARLHYEIHKHSTDGLPSQKERFADRIRKSSRILSFREKRILDYLEDLPEGNSICHGDFHFKNIIVSDEGPVAIDWSLGYKGNPLGDVARTCLILNLPPRSSLISNMLKILPDFPRRLIYRTYLDEYLKLAKVRFEDIDAWTLPVAAACLKDKIWDQKCLMNMIDQHLKKYNA